MTNMTPEQEKKILAITELMNGGNVAVLKKLIEFQDSIDQFKTTVDNIPETIKSQIISIEESLGIHISKALQLLETVNSVNDQTKQNTADILQLDTNLVQGLDELKQSLKSYVATTNQAQDALKNDLKRVEGKIPTQTNLEPLIAQIDAIRASIPQIALDIETKVEQNLPKLGIPIRDSLELLKDEERLDISAIKGVTARETTLSDSILNRAIGILDQRTSYLINKVSNIASSGTGGGGTASPLTTKGDLYTYSTANDRLPVGGNGTVLSSDSTQATGLKWIALAGGGDMVQATYDPAGIGEQLVGLTAAQTLTNKTLTSPKINENVALTTTATKLNYLTSATGTTGTASTNIVFSTSPTLTTPVLGVATVTSINKVVLTAPATASTLTIDDGFTLHVTGNVTALSGSSTGANTGDQTTVSGNAGTATALQNARTIGGVSFDGTANITVATATGGFTVSGGNLALGTNSLTLTGSIAATGARVTKGWFTDVESTNMPTVGGTAILTSLTAPQFTTIELGHASDTTLSRSAAGTLAVEGVDVLTTSNTKTLTNKTLIDSTNVIAELTTTASSSTPTPTGGSLRNFFTVTALAAGATFAAPSGSPVDNNDLVIRIKDNATARTLAWNAIYRASSDLALPTTTVISKTMYLGFKYNGADSKWDFISFVQNF